MALRTNRNKSSKKPLLIILLVAALAAASYTSYAWQKDTWPFQASSSDDTELSSSSSENDDFIDDTPATDDDQIEANKQKQQRYEEQQKSESENSSVTNSSAKSQKNVNVTLTTYYQEGDAIHANGFVAGVVESGGTCTLILTNESGKSVSSTRKGHNNATNTTCGQSTIKLDQLAPGKWTPELRYSSDTAKGTTGPNAWEAIEVK